MDDSTPNQPEQRGEDARALDIARMLARAGVPIFVARAIPGRPGQFARPTGWQHTAPDPAIVDTWQPGDALCAVGGGPADWLDCDAYNGGAQSRDELIMGGAWPTSYGQQSTPSGGTHDVIVPLRVGSRDGWMHGLDLKGGAADGSSRGYIYIAPTVKPAKAGTAHAGELGAYRWTQVPDMELLAECADTDDSGASVAARIGAGRAERVTPVVSAGATRPDDPFAPPSRLWGRDEARTQVVKKLTAFEAMRTPEDSGFNDALNELALFVGHFVPEFWPRDDVVGWLYDAAVTNRSVEFQGERNVRSTITSGLNAGMRQPFRMREPESEGAPAPGAPLPPAEPDAVDALLARMLDRDALDALPPPKPLIHGVLDMDSESWTIGPPGGFKSFVALDQAIHVALGRPWRGHLVEQGVAVYMAAEGSKGIPRRVRAWEAVYGERVRDLHFLPFPVQVSDYAGWAVLVEACVRLKAVMVVLDTQARITVGMEENSNTEMGKLVEAVRRLKTATGACVDVIHHTGRNGGDARGASALDGAQDTELRVDRPEDKAGRAALTATVSVDKQKDGDDSATWEIQMRVVDLGVDEYGERVTSLALEPVSTDPFGPVKARPAADWIANLPDNQSQVLVAMRAASDDTGATQAAVSAWIADHRKLEGRPGMGRTSLASALRDLKRKDLVTQRGQRYILTELITDDGEMSESE